MFLKSHKLKNVSGQKKNEEEEGDWGGGGGGHFHFSLALLESRIF